MRQLKEERYDRGVIRNVMHAIRYSNAKYLGKSHDYIKNCLGIRSHDIRFYDKIELLRNGK